MLFARFCAIQSHVSLLHSSCRDSITISYIPFTIIQIHCMHSLSWYVCRANGKGVFNTTRYICRPPRGCGLRLLRTTARLNFFAGDPSRPCCWYSRGLLVLGTLTRCPQRWGQDRHSEGFSETVGRTSNSPNAKCLISSCSATSYNVNYLPLCHWEPHRLSHSALFAPASSSPCPKPSCHHSSLCSRRQTSRSPR